MTFLYVSGAIALALYLLEKLKWSWGWELLITGGIGAALSAYVQAPWPALPAELYVGILFVTIQDGFVAYVQAVVAACSRKDRGGLPW